MTEKKQQLLLLRIERAGVKASRRSGHLVSREELLETRVQIIPLSLRLAAGTLGLGAAWAAFTFHHAGAPWIALLFGLLSFLLLIIGVFGFRRTVGKVLEGLDASSSAKLVELALRAIGELIDGLSP